jgi:hypothetical protein
MCTHKHIYLLVVVVVVHTTKCEIEKERVREKRIPNNICVYDKTIK